MSSVNANIPNEWGGYVTQTNVGVEVYPAILYDTKTYTDNSTTILSFFTTVPADEGVGNVNPPSILPNPAAFLIKNISLFFVTAVETIDQGAAAATLPSRMNDIILLCNKGILKLFIGEKPYGPYPMFRLPAATFVKGSLAAAGAEAANLVSAVGNLDGPQYPVLPPLLIAPMQKFRVELTWPAGAVDLSGNMDIKVLLDGQQSRAIQ